VISDNAVSEEVQEGFVSGLSNTLPKHFRWENEDGAEERVMGTVVKASEEGDENEVECGRPSMRAARHIARGVFKTIFSLLLF
tara:strand:+ start:578 stop:826 length:249 start_codon:yes stop_codon:yes gene_type:complete